MRIAVVVGNPKPQSRTYGVAVAVADVVGRALGESDERLVVDLADIGADLLSWDATAVTDLCASVAATDVIIAASPTYKATYTGLLKLWADRYGNNGLAGTAAIGVMTGAGAGHALAAEVHLRPLLVELGASVPSRSLYVTEEQFADLDDVIARWADGALPPLARAVGGGIGGIGGISG